MSKYDWLVWPETRDATKPSDISQADWDAAEKCFPGNAWNPVAIERAARAIAAEREACAQAVDALAMVLTDEIASATTHTHAQALSAQRHAILTASTAIRDRGEG